MKVYVITKGSYSDYSIYGVTVNPYDAEMMRKYFSDEWDEAQIEEYDTNDYKPIHEGKTQYHVYFRSDGTIYCHKTCCVYEIVNRIRKDRSGGYEICVWAVDEEHAIKIAQDKLAEYKYRKAMNEERK